MIAQSLFGMTEPPMFFDAILHGGTLAAVFIVFRRDILGLLASVAAPFRVGWGRAWREDGRFRLLVWLLLGTLPAGFAGVLLEDTFEALFGSVRAVGFALMITAVALLSTRWSRRNDTALEHLRWWQALVIGVAQAVAITPGISRSGATIVAGLHARLDREAAGRFSFLLSIPAILGAIVLEATHLNAPPVDLWTAALIGFVVSAAVGYGALRLLLWFVRFGRLYWFGVYCILAALFALTIS